MKFDSVCPCRLNRLWRFLVVSLGLNLIESHHHLSSISVVISVDPRVFYPSNPKDVFLEIRVCDPFISQFDSFTGPGRLSWTITSFLRDTRKTRIMGAALNREQEKIVEEGEAADPIPGNYEEIELVEFNSAQIEPSTLRLRAEAVRVRRRTRCGCISLISLNTILIACGESLSEKIVKKVCLCLVLA